MTTLNLLDLARPLGDALRPWPVIGDLMSPTLNRGDLAICRPVTAFEGEGVYVFDWGAIYRVDCWGLDGNLRLLADNKHYSTQAMSPSDFALHVLARVEFRLSSIVEGGFVPGVLEAAQGGERSWS